MKNLSCWLACLLLVTLSTPLCADDWPQWLGPQRDGVWREKGIVAKFPDGGPKSLWKAEVGMGYSGPAVANGKVYLTDRILAAGAKNPANPFAKDSVAGKERVLCFDAKTGQKVWAHEHDCTYQMSYPAGPRTTPVVTKDKVYTLGAMGDLLCLDAEKGKVLWSKNFVKEYDARVQAWGFSGHPLLDGDKLICLVGGEGSTVVAFHKDTGKELWKAVSSKAQGYCPPMIYQVGKTRQLIVWHAEAVEGLDPETGKVYWTQKFLLRSDLSIPTPRYDGEHLLVSAFYNGSMLLKLDPEKPTATLVWQGKGRGEQPKDTEGLHSIMVTPFIVDKHIYGVCSYGELRCLKLATGERVWADLSATSKNKQPVRWGNAFMVQHEDRWFLFNELGELILAKLSPAGYQEISRAKILEPTNLMAANFRDKAAVVWSHPAFAQKCLFARNDKELVCVSLSAE